MIISKKKYQAAIDAAVKAAKEDVLKTLKQAETDYKNLDATYLKLREENNQIKKDLENYQDQINGLDAKLKAAINTPDAEKLKKTDDFIDAIKALSLAISDKISSKAVRELKAIIDAFEK